MARTSPKNDNKVMPHRLAVGLSLCAVVVKRELVGRAFLDERKRWLEVSKEVELQLHNNLERMAKAVSRGIVMAFSSNFLSLG